MAKKSGKAKKIIKKHKENPVAVESASEAPVVDGDIPQSSPDYPETPKQKNEKGKGKKPPIGTEGNPRKFQTYGAEYVVGDVPLGVSEFYYIEVMEEPEGKAKPKWVLYGYEGFKHKGSALRTAEDYREADAVAYRDRLERDWYRENSHNQQTKQIVQLTVTKKTSKKAIEQFVEQIEEAKQKLKENPPVKKPDFSKAVPEFPKYRVRRRVLNVRDEDVE